MNTPKTRSLVVGSGIGGMSMALFLAGAGREVTLLEKMPKIGGLMQRFRRRGVDFDTGFHFTGGIDNMLGQMLKLLNIADLVKVDPIKVELYLRGGERKISFSGGGLEATEREIANEFPGEEDKIRQFFEIEKEVMLTTPLFDLTVEENFDPLAFDQYDEQTLDGLFDHLDIHGDLRAVLSWAAMCHGSPPEESPVKHHCRMSYGFDSRISRVREGGDAFIRGFEREAAKLQIKVITSRHIVECLDVDKRHCNKVRLDDGTVLEFDDAFFAVHPQSVLAIMPPEIIGEAHKMKFNNRKESCGFFSIYGVVEGIKPDDIPMLCAYLSGNDLNKVLRAEEEDYSTGIVFAPEDTATGKVLCCSAFRSVFPEETQKWENLSERKKETGYQAYKKRKTEEILADIYKIKPEYAGLIKILDSASMLTFRDYAPPTGSAYGVRQMQGVPPLLGRLPVRNFYLIGHGALIPGVVGTLMSSLIIFRQAVGRETFNKMVKERIS